MSRTALAPEEVLALPAMPTARQAFDALNISADLGYRLIKDGEFPLKVLEFGRGRALRVRRHELLTFLGLAENADGAGAATAPTPHAEQTPDTAK
ncbi:helix-turn-helix domain-containing protein [Streptomyces sp. SCSIO ZS0520]|uniref:helix-turn-helix domain-containing protein n=1 Tax=Streptomyces sp. SCSIO ZS0520 TaxID=2892996 RepID=UPI0021D871BF|nr:helix-turn-helix domain-containing protein [Streptomyces sp. SCSIO ZS0520]